MDKFLNVIFLIACVISTKAQADYSSALKNYNEKKFLEAMHEFQRTAALGHKDSQLKIGIIYFQGEGVTKNIIDGYAWTALSAEDNNASSVRIKDAMFSKMNEQQKIDSNIKLKELMSKYSNQSLYATLYPKYSEEKIKFKYAHYKAMPQIPDSALSDTMSKYELEYDMDPQGYIHNYIFLDTEGVKDPIKVVNYLASLKNYPQTVDGQPTWTYNIVSKHIRVGRGRAKQIKDEVNEEIREGFSPEINWLNAENLYQHAIKIKYISSSKKMQQHERLLMLSAAQMGHPKAQIDVALDIIYGQNYEQDSKKALNWLLAAASSNDNASLYAVASLLHEGKLINADKTKAIEFLQKAAEQQHVKSKVKLAWILATENEQEFFNPPKALQLITEVYNNYLDRVTAYETLAAAQAANEQFDNAISTQQSALNFAKEIGVDLEDAQAHLKSYEQHQAWRQ